MYVGEVSSVNAERVPSEAAEAAVARLREMSADLRGCALIGPGGQVLAATSAADRWGQAASERREPADSAGKAPASHARVATEDGKTSAAPCTWLAMVAM